MITELENIYMGMLLEGQLTPRPEEQEAYDRLVTLNNAAGTRDFTDALLQWYRSDLKQNGTDLSLDPTNHVRDTLKVLNRSLSNGDLKPSTMVTIETPKGNVKKDISNPRNFYKFDAFESALNNYMNQKTSSEGEQYIQQNDISNLDIKLYKVTPDLVVFATKKYEDTLAFIRVLWPKMQGTSNLGAYGKGAYQKDLCPFCTSGKSHWKEYSSGKNYTQYWILKNIGTNVSDYYGKGKDTIFAMLDSDGDLLNKYDEDFSTYDSFPPSFDEIINQIYDDNKKSFDKENDDSFFSILNRPSEEQLDKMRGDFIDSLKNETDENGSYKGHIDVPEYFNTLKPFSFIKEVKGGFNCRDNHLTSLVGAPNTVGGGFNCRDNHLTSLVGAPNTVGGGFNCSENQLTSLKGAPQNVDGYFDCTNNQLTSLEGAPQKVGGEFNCTQNQLTSLEGLPQEVGGSILLNNNPVNFTYEDIAEAQEQSRLKNKISFKEYFELKTSKQYLSED